ncbi:MAG: endonuclease/exonuclease/phosphatase family protein [Verrucomicrobia bacterium]|nr:endonuclease/exonuclease/phosphatase family protein [Verrucomicrobiota bacterium]MBS0645653.1 endonuclease/exonuclease/phosphatase family protein [Verrucomicrobiota bacterium]
MRRILLFAYLCLNSISLVGSVGNSIIGAIDQLAITDLDKKINSSQSTDMVEISSLISRKLRVMSFNMLLNYDEAHLDVIDRWEHRKNRVMEYVTWAHPDILGTQELQADQLEDILKGIGHDYAYYGLGVKDGDKQGDIPAIFYLKDRFTLIESRTYYYSDTPDVVSNDPFGKKNTFTCCLFKDRKSDKPFLVINTHLSFSTVERRYDQACRLRDFLIKNRFNCPVFITGDFNTFPFRQQLDLPFYDGDLIVRILEQGGVTDSLKLAVFGHFGPIDSTNFCAETKKPFCSQGTPGVILDHIFVSPNVTVIAHGIDPAKVDGHFPSDHFPVIVDCLLK